ncbi:chloramphenicol resistance permease RarD [Youhaiella tibetensis]|uniref:EamA family transporter RarD n=1 Tax=Paradevosia tibetensis TaxID=1447062 RepID=A0A5B9DPU1_9HYPH|nr:EamA family transporter RarD [Youhaiella tibetensis]QEE21420.1 EamA family transporter RarD [Youhaiella tibetensis]GGF15180.1 chloramphenicol resistance permease RarD [Youhaiella tibetensis]
MASQDGATADRAPAKGLVTIADTRGGVMAAIATYGSWGVLPLLFHQLSPVDPVLVVAHRTVWSLIFVSVLLGVGNRFAEVRAVLADPRSLRTMFISALLLGCNWLLYVWAVQSGRVLEASLGYFINPLVNVAIGIVLLGEKQNRWQVVAIVIAVVAIAIQGVALGTLPLVSLGLALTFGFYGYFRKTVSAPSAIGLFVETLLLTPFALGFIAYSWHAQGIGALADPYLLVLVISTGPATAIPLLFFAYAVRQLRMTTIGMFQYISPSLQFLLGVLAFGEHLSPVGLLSFALIWVSLVIFTVDGLRRRPAVPA